MCYGKSIGRMYVKYSIFGKFFSSIFWGKETYPYRKEILK